MATIIQTNDKLIIDGKEIKSYPKSNGGCSIVQIDGKIYINGYRYHSESSTFTFDLWYWLKHIFS